MTMKTLYSSLYDYQKAYLNEFAPTLVPQQKAPPLLLATPKEKQSALERIEVRRLLLEIERVIAEATAFSLFEFNDAFTRRCFIQMVEPYLDDLRLRGCGIHDFKVICDETNNTPEVIASNEFVGDIYVRPTCAIKYIQLNFVATRTAVGFEEVAGNF